jgi:hypothetical protein
MCVDYGMPLHSVQYWTNEAIGSLDLKLTSNAKLNILETGTFYAKNTMEINSRFWSLYGKKLGAENSARDSSKMLTGPKGTEHV